MAGIVFAVGEHHQDLRHPLALGIGCQLPAGKRHRIEQRRATVVGEFVHASREPLVVAREVLGHVGRFRKANDKTQVRTVGEHLLQELRGSMLFKREPRLHRAAGINHYGQAQRQLRLGSELQYFFGRLAVIADRHIAQFEAGDGVSAAGDAEKHRHLIHDLANGPLRRGIAAAVGSGNRCRLGIEFCGGSGGLAAMIATAGSGVVADISQLKSQPVRVRQVLRCLGRGRRRGLVGGSSRRCTGLLVSFKNVEVVARSSSQWIGGILLQEER